MKRVTLFVRIPEELKKWLQHRMVDTGHTQEEEVCAALRYYRARMKTRDDWEDITRSPATPENSD